MTRNEFRQMLMINHGEVIESIAIEEEWPIDTWKHFSSVKKFFLKLFRRKQWAGFQVVHFYIVTHNEISCVRKNEIITDIDQHRAAGIRFDVKFLESIL